MILAVMVNNINIFSVRIVNCFQVSINTPVIPVCKRGNSINIENYRHLTIINIILEAFEILIYQPIFAFAKNTIMSFQYGFIECMSTTTNLFVITKFLFTAFDNHIKVNVLYTPFSKSFDNLDYSVLL